MKGFVLPEEVVVASKKVHNSVKEFAKVFDESVIQRGLMNTDMIPDDRLSRCQVLFIINILCELEKDVSVLRYMTKTEDEVEKILKGIMNDAEVTPEELEKSLMIKSVIDIIGK